MQSIAKHDVSQTVILSENNVTQIDTKQAMYLQKGDTLLVRSKTVPELGDHFITVTGPVVQKPHGLRPQTITIPIPGNHHPLLDKYNYTNGVIALKLNVQKI